MTALNRGRVATVAGSRIGNGRLGELGKGVTILTLHFKKKA